LRTGRAHAFGAAECGDRDEFAARRLLPHERELRAVGGPDRPGFFAESGARQQRGRRVDAAHLQTLAAAVRIDGDIGQT